MNPSPRLAISRLLAAALATLPLATAACAQPVKPPLGVMGTIPIYWGEAREFGDQLNGKAAPHWARDALEHDYALQPLDYLDTPALAGVDRLLLAQPRALSAEENVALDAWVRDGGHLLLFADPLMTGESAFAIGDRRRPQDVALLSPILAHWGLVLELPEDQKGGPREVDAGKLRLPVDMAGRFSLTQGEAKCTLAAGAVLAQCRIGGGSATIVADAAVLNLYDPDPLAEPALERLVAQAFGDSREIAGQ